MQNYSVLMSVYHKERNGRIIRQGNKNKQVYVYNYVTEGTFDAYLWQTLENKHHLE